MTKLLRKYNKWLLGVGGSLLMVTFLLTGPQSIFQPDPTKRVVATMAGASVHQKEVGQADKEFEALKAYMPFVMQQMGIESGQHWMLLSRAAEEAGMVGGEGDGVAWIPELSELVAQGAAQHEIASQLGPNAERFMQQPYIQQVIRQKAAGYIPQVKTTLEANRPRVASSERLSLQQFDMALSKLRGVRRMMMEYATAARVSDRRAVTVAKRAIDQVLVDAVVIPASKALDAVPEPTEAQIDEQYLKYKDTKPGTGDYGFGYLQPERVKFEWMMLDRDSIAATITINPVDANKFWRQNKDKYKGEFTADRAQVEADLRNAKVDQILQDADRYYKTHLRGYTRALTQDAAVKKLPADWETKRPKMADLAAELDKSLKAQNPAMPAPIVDARTAEWVKVALASNIPGVGASRFRVGTKQGTLADLLSELSELNSSSSLGLQAKVPYENPLTDGKGNVYYINVLDYRAESAPESIDEVKADVTKDVKLLAAFESLKGQQAELQLQAVKDGLDAIAAKYPTPAIPGAADQTPKPLQVMKLASVRREVGQGMLDAAPVREAVMNAADAAWAAVQGDARGRGAADACDCHPESAFDRGRADPGAGARVG